MKKCIYVLCTLVLLFFYSCSNDDISSSLDSDLNLGGVKSDRIYFEDMTEFENILKSLDKMNISDRKNWSNERIEKSFYSLAYLSDSTLAYLPNSLKTLLNEDLEFAIGDSILWFNNYKLVFLSESKGINKEQLTELKNNPNGLKVFYDLRGLSENQTRAVGNLESSTAPVHIKTQDITLGNEKQALVRSSNQNLNGVPITELRVRFELSVYSFSWSALEYMNGYRQYNGDLIIRTFTKDANGNYIEINIPELSFTLNTSWSYSYSQTSGRVASLVESGNWIYTTEVVGDMGWDDLLISNGNTYNLFQTAYTRITTFENMVVILKNGYLKCKLTDKDPAIEFIIENINL